MMKFMCVLESFLTPKARLLKMDVRVTVCSLTGFSDYSYTSLVMFAGVGTTLSQNK